MTIAAQQLEDWTGKDVVDPGGEKLGKLGELFYRGDTPVLAEVRSGLAGRKRHLVPLDGATVTRDALVVTTDADRLVATHGTPTDDELRQLGEGGLGVDATATQLESATDRTARLGAAEEAERRARELEVEAQLRDNEARNAAHTAAEADAARVAAQEARDDAIARADAARQEAQLARGESMSDEPM